MMTWFSILETNDTDYYTGQTTLMSDHEYTVYHYDPSTNSVWLRNPWGGGSNIEVTFAVSLDTLCSDGDWFTIDDAGSMPPQIDLLPNPATCAYYLNNISAYDEIVNHDSFVGAIQISDTAANISNCFDALNADAGIGAITISDNGAIVLSVAQALNDAAAIGKLANANGSPVCVDVSDTGPNIAAELDTLNADPDINGITISPNNSVVFVSAGQALRDTVAIGKLEYADGSPCYVVVQDTAANVAANLDALNADPDIFNFTITDNGAFVVSAVQALSDATAISELYYPNLKPYPVTVQDTAATLSADLNALNAAVVGPLGGQIAKIAISDNGAITLTAQQVTDDAAAIALLVKANGAPGVVVSDSAANIVANLSALQADAAHIASITASGGTVTVDHDTYVADEAALDKIVGGFDVQKSNYTLTTIETTSALQAYYLNNDYDITIAPYVTLYINTPTLTIGSAPDCSQITFENFSEIYGGVIVDEGSGLGGSGGTLSGVTYQGTLDLAGDSNLAIANGLTATGLNGAGPGAIDMATFDTLWFDDTQTFDNATVTMGTADYIQQYNTGQATGILTLGPNLVIDVTSGAAHINGNPNASGGIVVNNGQINVQAAGSELEIGGQAFTNAGTIGVASGATLWVYSSSFANSGTIDVARGDTFVLGGSGSQTYTTASALGGTINASAATVVLEPYTTLNNAGSTLTIGAGSSIGTLSLSNYSTVSGGVIVDEGSGLGGSGGTLSGVTYEGTLNLVGDSILNIALNPTLNFGLIATGLDGSGPGAIAMAAFDQLWFYNTQTFDSAAVTMGGNAEYIQQYNTGQATGTLTLGPNLVIDVTSSWAHINGVNNVGGGVGIVVNDGQINVTGSGSALEISGQEFTNDGTINVGDSGATLLVDANSFTNNGTIEVGAGDTLELDAAQMSGNGQIDMAAGSTLDFLANGVASSFSISGNSTFYVAYGDTETITGSINDSAGGPAGVISETGDGTLALDGNNGFSGGLKVSGGTLELGNANAAGTGSITMSAGTTLGFAAGGLNIANDLVISGDPIVDVGLLETLSGEISDPNGGAPAGRSQKGRQWNAPADPGQHLFRRHEHRRWNAGTRRRQRGRNRRPHDVGWHNTWICRRRIEYRK